MLINLLVFGLQYTLVLATGLQIEVLYTTCTPRDVRIPVHFVPPLDDCRKAIDMIPAGSVIFQHGQPGIGGKVKPFEAHLDLPGGRRKVVLPAAFNHRSCWVSVTGTMEGPASPHGPANASTMYFRVWPEVQAIGNAILEQCLRTRSGHSGSIGVKILLEKSWWPLNVLIVHDWIVSRETFGGSHIYDTDELYESSPVPNTGEFLPGRGG